MTIPQVPLYPDSFDNDENLYLVHDSLTMILSEDYSPGDKSIKVTGDPDIANKMPESGCITLTEQCSELENRAITFHYGSFDLETYTFSDLELLPEFTDSPKDKRITKVSINVLDKHHNNVKDAIIAVQKFIGLKGEEDLEPLGDTMEGRVNFLRKLVFQPKAWFSVDSKTGNVPLCVTFTDQSFRLGTDGDAGELKVTWDFGDQSSLISVYSTISVSDTVPDNSVDVYVRDTDGKTIKKCYQSPGLYSVKLTVENDFGSDTIEIPDLINARAKAPEPAIIRLVEQVSIQDSTPGVPPDGPFETVPKIRSPINTLIKIEIDSGENISTPGYSYAGEALNDLGQAIDPINEYIWSLGDDLQHANSSETTAAFSVGGIYDLKLRVNSTYGSYRITTYEDCIDIVEYNNLWLWVYQDSDTISAYEFGLISETFKLNPPTSLNIQFDDSFLDNLANSDQQKKEFAKNVGFSPRGTLSSGKGGSTMLYYASGRGESDLPATETINLIEFDGFSGTYITRDPIGRQWNWANFNNPSGFSYFIFGDMPSRSPNLSETNLQRDSLELSGFTLSSTDFVDSSFLNGANELEQNPAVYDGDGESTYGHFSVYRTTWKDQSGYLARNDGVGPFFRIKSFYKTEGVVGNQFLRIKKLNDIQGPTKLEGNIVGMSEGIYFLNNSGSISKYVEDSAVWTTGGPGVNSFVYRNLQDTTVQGFDSQENTMLVATDFDKRAYLSFDYSVNAFIKFSEIDLTYSTLGSRPEGTQFGMGAY